MSWLGLFLGNLKSGKVPCAFIFSHLSILIPSVNLKLAAESLMHGPWGTLAWLFATSSVASVVSAAGVGSWLSVCDKQNWGWLRNAKPQESRSHHFRLHWCHQRGASFPEFQRGLQGRHLASLFPSTSRTCFSSCPIQEGREHWYSISDFHFLFPLILWAWKMGKHFFL